MHISYNTIFMQITPRLFWFKSQLIRTALPCLCCPGIQAAVLASCACAVDCLAGLYVWPALSRGSALDKTGPGSCGERTKRKLSACKTSKGICNYLLNIKNLTG